ncbi:MAG TPA: CDGSH iron-sulfur domain-containing protein [Rikenellaceae bacterium]|nr:CDGSH iron-sulfur domain-containing protein [Rikenellaceae bacterium]
MEAQGKVKIKLIENGPAKIEGPVTVIHPDGMEEDKSICYICRCTGSQNKPWCDGSHAK